MSRNTFANVLNREANFSTTENGNPCLKSTGDEVLNLFATIGSLRNRSESEVIRLWNKAYNENKELSLKTLFYSRDIRGGLGERNTFRIILKHLVENDRKAVERNLKYIPEMGRWDDLYVILSNNKLSKRTKLYKDTVSLIKKQFNSDLKAIDKNKPISLLGKWLKSVNTSSKSSNRLGKLTAEILELSISNYRKKLSRLRSYLKVTEVNMSSNSWDLIEYSEVPSYAMKNYSNAFNRHDNKRFSKYLDKVISGKEKINSSTLYPSDIVSDLIRNNKNSEVLESQWNSLPDYVRGDFNALVMADTSGSMIGDPMNISIGLAVYFAERNKGDFHNLFMTFSETPSIVKLNDHDSLREKLREVERSDWGYNTNLRSAFQLILDLAIKNKIPKKDMIKSLIVVSDMEIDSADRYSSSGSIKKDFHDEMKSLYKKYGYDLPHIVFWNVNSRNDTFHSDKDRKGVTLLSGRSSSSFKNLFKLIKLTPYEAMLEVLNGDRYNNIK